MLVLGWALLALSEGQEEAGGPEERSTKGRREVWGFPTCPLGDSPDVSHRGYLEGTVES